jgi:hypothetical protein
MSLLSRELSTGFCNKNLHSPDVAPRMMIFLYGKAMLYFAGTDMRLL